MPYCVPAPIRNIRPLASPASNLITPSASRVMCPSVPAASVVARVVAPAAAAVIVKVSLVSPVMVITLPFITTSSTVNAVRVPRLVMFV